MFRTIVKVQGFILILLAISSLLIGGKALHGALNITLMENGIHLLTGGWLVLAGYRVSEKTIYVSVAVLSAMFLVLGVPELFSSTPLVANDYSWVHRVIRLVVGGLGVVVLIVGLPDRRRGHTGREVA